MAWGATIGRTPSCFSVQEREFGFTVRPPRHDVFMMKRMFDSPTRRASTVRTAANLRRHRAAVVRWALAHGHPVDRDSLAVIIDAASVPTPGQVGLHWTSQQVNALLSEGCTSWCACRGVQYPDGISRSLTTYLRYLSAHRLLDADSDTMTDLKRTVAAFDKCHLLNQNQKGAKARHPTSQKQFLAPVLPLY